MLKIINKILKIILNILTIIFQYIICWLAFGLYCLDYIIKDYIKEFINFIKTLPEKIFIHSTKSFIYEQLYKYPILTKHKIKIKYFYIPFKKNDVTINIYINENLYLIDKLCGCSIDNAIEMLTDQFEYTHYNYVNNIKFKINLV
jgi:hypothetical protein